jgi:hypothetical protein
VVDVLDNEPPGAEQSLASIEGIEASHASVLKAPQVAASSSG